MKMNNFGTVDYSKNKTPKGYVCSKCNSTDVKLWRQYNTFLDHIELMCVKCAGEAEGKDVSNIDDNGMIDSDVNGKTDQIGWLIPAVPTSEGDSFWGYTSVPQDGCDWWRKLKSCSDIKKERKLKLEEIEKR